MSIELFVKAAADGDTHTMSALLIEEPNLAEQTLPNGMSPLTAALYYGKQQSVEWLLEQGVTVTIHEAAALGDEETLAYMLNLEPKLLEQFSFDGWTPLHLAAFFGGVEAAQLLIDRGADVNMRSANALENAPIHIAAAGNRTSIIELLLKNGADPNARQSGGWTPIHQAAERCDAETVALLLRHGADPDLQADDGTSARSIAAEKGFEKVLQLLS